MSIFKFYESTNREWNIYSSMLDEVTQNYGVPCKFIPKEHPSLDTLFGEDGALAEFNEFFDINLYLEDMTQFSGVGDMFTRFGLQVDDQCSFFCSQERIITLLGRYPNAGDLILFGTSRDDMFEINHVEDKAILYPFGRNYCFKFFCKKFRYSHEVANTGIPEFDILNDLSNTDIVSDNDAETTSPNTGILDFTEDNPYNDI